MTRFAETRNAPLRACAVLRIDLEAHELPAVLQRRNRHCAASYERIEDEALAGAARQHHAPDDLVHHRQARLQITEDFRTVLPGQKNVKAAAGLELRNHGVDPAPAEVEIGAPAQAVRVVPVVLAEAVRRVGDDEIHARLGDADDAVEQISVEEHCVRVAQNWIPDFSATVCMSLSPRPERLTRRILSLGSDGASFAAWASACADSRAGMMPSLRHRSWNAATASPSSMVTY